MTREELQELLIDAPLLLAQPDHKCTPAMMAREIDLLCAALVEVASEVPCPKCLYRRPRSPAELSEGIPEWPKCSACKGTRNKYNLEVGDE